MNSVDYDQRTTLHMACMEGNVKIVEMLIEAGRDLELHMATQRLGACRCSAKRGGFE